jgi:alanine dehydrogenase
MKIGVPKEIKKHEYRVGLTPAHAAEYVHSGHTVYIQSGAGTGSGFADGDYAAAGCLIIGTAEEIYGSADMIIKVKEPLEPEYKLMRPGQILFTYFHLAADRKLTEAVLESNSIAIAYETITDGRCLPCLKPMSEIAGRLAVQEGAKYLEKPFGGRGILTGGVTGTLPARVLILGGGGVVGRNAVAMAAGLQADVVAMDINLPSLEYINELYSGRVKTLYSTDAEIARQAAEADIVIGAALVPGAATPKLLKRAHLKNMKPGAVVVDVAIDQGGAFESSHVTYHDAPVYSEEGIIHYCVGNMPGAVPCTSTVALNNATLKYGLQIAAKGCRKALSDNPGLASGLNAYMGTLTCAPVGELFGIPIKAPSLLLAS